MEKPKEKRKSNFPDPRYIIVGYDPEHYRSAFIKDEDVVRPPNHWCTTVGETPENWSRDKSSAGCPTYGSCQACMMSGLVDECYVKCSKCVRYMVVKYGTHTMDSITLTEMIGAGHVRARANRTQAWLCTPFMCTSINYYTMAVDHQKTLTKEEKKEFQEIFYDDLPR